MDEPMKEKLPVKDEQVNCDGCFAVTSLSKCLTSAAGTYCSRECLRNKAVMTSKKHSKHKNGNSGRNARVFDWGTYIDSEKCDAAPVSTFKHCFLSDRWCSAVVGMKVEVPLSKAEIGKLDGVYWIATVIKTAGYKAKLRYEGYGSDQSADFWVNLCSADVHHVGWCAEHGKNIVPPVSIATSQANWWDYLLERIVGSGTLAVGFHEEFKAQIGKHDFRVGMMLEVVDKMCIAAMKVAKIIETVDCRLHLQYEGTGLDSNDFWCHKNSTLIHPVGWSATVGHRLHASSDYIQSTLTKSQTGKYSPEDCTDDMFAKPPEPKFRGFSVGMRLEAIDPLNLSTICVATVMKVLKNDYLMIGIDGCMDTRHGNDWFCYHASSACILPAGYCEINDITLTPPKGYEGLFNWKEYLQKTKSYAAPVKLFESNIPRHSFKPRLKLEAVDLMDPRLLCVATVEQVVGRLLRLHFDGWENTFDQWVDCESSDIYPVGWCEIMKYGLEGPKRMSISESKPLKQK